MDARFIYFDGQDEREEVITLVQEVREDVLALAAQIPEAEHFTPRYYGRSIAVLLAQLELADTAALWFVRAASNGYNVRLPRAFIKTGRNLMTHLYQRRLVKTSINGIRKKEQEICEFIRTVPMSALSANVRHPGRSDPYTVEKAIQIYFVHHWQIQLALMQHADKIAGR